MITTTIKVVDAIMGSGKTQAAITYMTEHDNDKFIYITPYLDETIRVKNGCPSLCFVAPSNSIEKYHFTKSEHTVALIKEGRNIVTTHQAFKRYTQSTLDDIREQGYTLIIDENVDVLESFGCHHDDLQIALDAGYIIDNNGSYSIANKEYKGEALRGLFNTLHNHDLIRVNGEDSCALYYWLLPMSLFTSFKDVYILTYLFDGQSLHHFLKIYNIPYEHIGVEQLEDGKYHFCDSLGYTPEYTNNLKDMIHILDNGKINDVGKEHFAFSMNWFKRNSDCVEQAKKNLYNCINNIWRDVPLNQKLWGTYNSEYNRLRGKGYSKSFLTFNSKATNAFKDRDHLAYLVNIFQNANEKRFYNYYGVDVDGDIYALSIMVQWIWRSAIRDGKEIWLYIPSKRMRTLLINWIDKTSKGESIIDNKAM